MDARHKLTHAAADLDQEPSGEPVVPLGRVQPGRGAVQLGRPEAQSRRTASMGGIAVRLSVELVAAQDLWAVRAAGTMAPHATLPTTG